MDLIKKHKTPIIIVASVAVIGGLWMWHNKKEKAKMAAAPAAKPAASTPNDNMSADGDPTKGGANKKESPQYKAIIKK